MSLLKKQDEEQVIKMTEIEILIIDDDPQILDVLYRMLTHCGYNVQTAVDGQDGIECLVDNNCYSVVITDIQMPDKTGNDVARHIRNFIKENPPLVIGLSGVVEMAEKDLFDILISKPFKMKEIIQIIKNDGLDQNLSINKKKADLINKNLPLYY